MPADVCIEQCRNIFMWRIVNFNTECKYETLETIHSPLFRIKSLSGSTWKFGLMFFPGGTALSDDKFASVFLILNPNDESILHCKYSVEIIAVDGSVFHSKSNLCKFNPVSGTGWHDYIEIDSLKSKAIYFPGNTLIFRCELHDLLQYSPTNFQFWGETTIGIDQITCNYFVENLYLFYESQAFECPASSMYKLRIRRYRTDIVIEVRKFLQDNLKQVEQHHVKQSNFATLKIILFDTKGLKLYSRTRRVMFQNDCNLYAFQPCIPLSLLSDEETNFSKKITFNLVCEFTITNKTCSNTTEFYECQSLPYFYPPPSSNKLTDLQEIFLTLYTAGKHTDITLKVGDKEFLVHRFILLSRSRTFNEMLENSDSSCLHIIDVECRIFDVFLKYLYAGIMETLDYELATNLLMLADEYGVSSLKQKCSYFLKQILSERDITSD